MILIVFKFGAIAQLGERYAGSVEVRGSIPLGSIVRTATEWSCGFFACTSSMGVISRVKVPNGGWRTPTVSQEQGHPSKKHRVTKHADKHVRLAPTAKNDEYMLNDESDNAKEDLHQDVLETPPTFMRFSNSPVVTTRRENVKRSNTGSDREKGFQHVQTGHECTMKGMWCRKRFCMVHCSYLFSRFFPGFDLHTYLFIWHSSLNWFIFFLILHVHGLYPSRVSKWTSRIYLRSSQRAYSFWLS